MLLGIEENWGINMNFIAVINKYSRDTKYTKTKLYHYCEEHKKELESIDIRFKIKSEIDLFNMEIVLRSLEGRDAIEGSYDLLRQVIMICLNISLMKKNERCSTMISRMF